MSLLSAVKQANQPGPPEHSIVLRASATLAVVVAIAACWAQSELSTGVAATSIALVLIGNVFSYWRRSRPLPFLKIALAAGVLGAFLWFFATISRVATAGDLGSVEGPLAVLFAVIQVTHAFDVPSRRDLAFSLAGSATLMAVAGAQAVNSTFGVFVVIWAACGLVGLLAQWGSMAGGARIRLRTVAVVAGAVAVIGVAVVAVLPAPHANSNLVLPSSIAHDLPVSSPAGLVGGGTRGTEPLKAGSPTGRTRVGGYLGFAGPLDTAIRGTLGNQVVFRVRADRPSFWIAETFNHWNGQSWSTATPPRGTPAWRQINSGPPFSIPLPVGEVSHGTGDYQTFYIAQSGPNLVFHAANASLVWFPAGRLYEGQDGTIRSGTSMGPGSIYTVFSELDQATPSQLERAPTSVRLARSGLAPTVRAQALQLPHAYRRAAALAHRVTAHAASTYAKVVALENWIGSHTKYTTHIPALAPGQDTVNQFLFGTRRGYCEQISTALAVMLRSLGIPAREATGYVPGSYNPITDLYQEEAKDAHAWVQVWFPGYGWQSFDPTALVPLANPTPGDVIGHDLVHLLEQVPWAPLGIVAALTAFVVLVVRHRRSAPRTWAAAMTREIEHAARRNRSPVRPGDTLVDIAARLDGRLARRHDQVGRPDLVGGPDGHQWGARSPDHLSTSLTAMARVAERAAFGDVEPDRDTRRDLLRSARRIGRRSGGWSSRRIGRRSGRRGRHHRGARIPTT
ncbi:MAG: transglutaminase family protein [Acidimicrobiales bacterium]